MVRVSSTLYDNYIINPQSVSSHINSSLFSSMFKEALPLHDNKTQTSSFLLCEAAVFIKHVCMQQMQLHPSLEKK